MVRNIVRIFIPFDSALQLLEISFLGDTQKCRAELQQKRGIHGEIQKWR